MLGDSMNINNFNWNPVVLKKKKLEPGPTCAKMGSLCTTPKTKNFFFSEITKPDQNIICFG